MTKLSKIWTGQFFGTNVGNFYIEFDNPDQNLNGLLRFNDSNFGVSIYKISGEYNQPNKFKIRGGAVESINKKIVMGDIEIEAELISDGSLKGKWKTSVETAGIFIAFPGSPPLPKSETFIPEEIHTKNITLGAIRLFSNDLVRLFEEIKKGFTQGRLVITHNVSHETMQFAEDFLKTKHNLKKINWLKIFIQEPSGNGINRMVLIELGVVGTNNIRVQGPDESWVIGKAEKLAIFLKAYQNSLITIYKKFGLIINTLIFFTMLIVTPSINLLWQRAIFVFTVFILLMGLLQLYKHFVPITTIKMTSKKPGWFSRTWPSIISWVATIAAAVIASFIFYWFTKKPPS